MHFLGRAAFSGNWQRAALSRQNDGFHLAAAFNADAEDLRV